MKDILDIKNSILKKQINSYEEISKINNEIDNLAKDKTVGQAVKTLERLNKLINGINLNTTNDILRKLNNSTELEKQGQELKRINELLGVIANKDPTVKVADLIKFPTEPKDAIPVVLTDKFKEEFYDALKSLPVYFGGGSNVDTTKLATNELQQELIEAINNLEINIDTLDINTDEIEEKLDTIIDENKDGSQKTQIQETLPDDSTKLNPSYLISYNATYDIVKIEETVGATTYTSNITPTNGDTVIVYTKSISSWT